ncbi:MAG: D-alanine--D-alanine ligase [Polaribacter sp.]|jgi:hypothetical protein|nr:D-alanine--D-alanine ligase [Polaribacter sp.]MDG1953436.1 D-alanine--D-alanine ligase [Polaribacter sp.]MDG2074329.1 D-alanine--D-alanine ligase [Polaribacter sp.]
MNSKKNIHKLLNWEYWPNSMFYIPNIPFAFFHAIKAKNLVFYTAVNPTIENSGIGTESKFETMQLIPEKYSPITIFHKTNSNIDETIDKVRNQITTYPLIAKPDIGFRGLLVQKIDSESELLSYLEKYPIDILIQEFLTEKKECGIFYLRYPDNQSGKITSITLKDFLHIVGDGKQTLEELISSDKRAKNYIKIIKSNTTIPLNTIIKKNKKIQLSVIGNHSKGTQFINGNHLISEKLEKTITELNKQIDGWYYGRIDIKYNTFEDLENGNFKILELNGILAEPTHIYDASKSNYLKALKEMRVHWKQLYRIARINHDENNVPYRSTVGLLKDVKKLKKYTKSIVKLNKI